MDGRVGHQKTMHRGRAVGFDAADIHADRSCAPSAFAIEVRLAGLSGRGLTMREAEAGVLPVQLSLDAGAGGIFFQANGVVHRAADLVGLAVAGMAAELFAASVSAKPALASRVFAASLAAREPGFLAAKGDPAVWRPRCPAAVAIWAITIIGATGRAVRVPAQRALAVAVEFASFAGLFRVWGGGFAPFGAALAVAVKSLGTIGFAPAALDAEALVAVVTGARRTLAARGAKLAETAATLGIAKLRRRASGRCTARLAAFGLADLTGFAVLVLAAAQITWGIRWIGRALAAERLTKLAFGAIQGVLAAGFALFGLADLAFGAVGILQTVRRRLGAWRWGSSVASGIGSRIDSSVASGIGFGLASAFAHHALLARRALQVIDASCATGHALSRDAAFAAGAITVGQTAFARGFAGHQTKGEPEGGDCAAHAQSLADRAQAVTRSSGKRKKLPHTCTLDPLEGST